MNKLIITHLEGRICTALVDTRRSSGEVVQMNLEPPGSSFMLGNILIGKVQNIVKNINAAFVDIGNGQMGYYSLTENKIHHYTKGAKAKTAPVKIGDELLVEVERDAVKTKAPVLSSRLSFPGRYTVVTAGKPGIGFSGKITDKAWKETLKPAVSSLLTEKGLEEELGCIIRTNAGGAAHEDILNELNSQTEAYQKLMEDSRYRTCFSILRTSLPPFIAGVRDACLENLEAVITDEKEIFDSLYEYMKLEQPDFLPKLVFYEDSLLPLAKCYSLETALAKALHKNVWLKSGGYLVIEPTEALTVIDVNTGKYSGKKNVRETIMKINKEAAEEIAGQLRLRNLSGIIVVDFINMEEKEDMDELMAYLTQCVRTDPVKTTVVDMTSLNLVEITRKKVRKPLYEQVKE